MEATYASESCHSDYRLRTPGSRIQSLDQLYFSQCQVHNKYSINICSMNEDFTRATVHCPSINLLSNLQNENDNDKI